jgi:hypothetical protein
MTKSRYFMKVEVVNIQTFLKRSFLREYSRLTVVGHYHITIHIISGFELILKKWFVN